jgi:hypothetical protein
MCGGKGALSKSGEVGENFWIETEFLDTQIRHKE